LREEECGDDQLTCRIDVKIAGHARAFSGWPEPTWTVGGSRVKNRAVMTN
jgi:hypothetical protein